MISFKNILLLLLLTLLTSNLYSSHIVGGEMTYAYIGSAGQLHRYNIRLTLYINCDNSSEIPFPEDSVSIGLYGHNLANPTLDKPFISSYYFRLTDTALIKPSLNNACTFGSQSCLIKGIYEKEIILPSSIDGYHLFYQRCCRNQAIINLLANQGSAFHVYIPPTSFLNSSPQFIENPLPFICAGETVSVANTIWEPDGDQIIYSFALPYQGFADQFNTNPGPPVPVLNWPIPNIIYSNGYSIVQPFGNLGFSSINALDGISSYLVPQPGNFVITVEAKEYRNGVYLGAVRRDLQLLVLACPSNPPPEITLSTSLNSVHVGDTACLQINITDPNANLIDVNIQTYPTISESYTQINSSTAGSMSISYCFYLPCSLTNEPHKIFIEALDNGCPSKSDYLNIDILPQPNEFEGVIAGPVSVCTGSDTIIYSLTNLTDEYTTQWEVINGNMIPLTNDSIGVEWSQGISGLIRVIVNNPLRCISDTLTTAIMFDRIITVDAGVNDSVCRGEVLTLNTSLPGTYNWSGQGNFISTGGITNYTPQGSGYIFVEYSDNTNCSAKDSAYIFVLEPPVLHAFPDTILCPGDSLFIYADSDYPVSWTFLPNNTQLNNQSYFTPTPGSTIFAHSIAANGCVARDTLDISFYPIPLIELGPDRWICPGSQTTLNVSGALTYIWKINGLLNPDTGSNLTITVLQNLNITTTGISSDGCINSDTILLFTGNQIPVEYPDSLSVCLNQSIQITNQSSVYIPGLYHWTPGTGLLDNTSPNPLFTGNNSTLYHLLVEQDTCSAHDSVWIDVKPLPSVDIQVNSPLCVNDTLLVIATGSSNYEWFGELILDNYNDSIRIIPMNTSWLFVNGTDVYGCMNTDSIQFQLFSLPNVSAGKDTSLCIGDTIQLFGAGANSYQWTFIPGSEMFLSQNILISPTESSVAILEGTDTNGCRNIDSVKILLHELPYLTVSGDSTVCPGDTALIVIESDAGIQWTPSVFLLSDTSKVQTVNPTVTTMYVITAQDDLGCKNERQLTIAVDAVPISGFTYFSTFTCSGYQLNVKDSLNSVVEWYWGDGTNTQGSESTHMYNNPESILLQQVVINEAGCTDTAFLALSKNNWITDMTEPVNIFTPDGDGLNDYFVIHLEQNIYECSSLRIMNRWGNVIYSLVGLQDYTWDGKTELGVASAGVYFWILSINNQIYTGTITLSRNK